MEKIDEEKIKKVLVSNGFTENEAKIYLSLLKTGPINASELSSFLQMDKTSVYRASNRLSSQGLILKTGDKYNSKLSVEDINRIKNLIENKKTKAEKGFEEIENFIQNLPEFTKSEYLKSKVEIFEGEDAVFRLYEERIKEKVPLIREVSSNNVQTNLTPDDPEYWKDHIARRIKMGIYSHMLIDSSDLDSKFHRTSKEQFKEVRMVPEDFKLTSGVNIFGNKVAFHNTNSSRILGIIIDDPTISTIMTSFFDFVWNRSKKI